MSGISREKSLFSCLGNDISETSEEEKNDTKFFILSRYSHHMPGNR
jgi:hypothetical protein